MDFNTLEAHSLINKFYADPILKEWHPSDFSLKYEFPPTPRGQAKLAKRKAKEDAKLKAAFENAVAIKANVHRVIDEIAKYPIEIATLFFNVFKWKISNLEKCHEEFMALKNELPKYGEYVSKNVNYFKHHLTKTTYDFSISGRRISRKRFCILDDDEWNKLVMFMKGEFREIEDGKWDYEYPLKDIEDPKAFMEFLVKYFEAHDRDDVAIYGKDVAYVNAIIHIADMLDGIMHDIDKHFNGNKPTQCLTPPSWGFKGEYCGVLTDGTTKVSFKSFEAGGFNIQKYHFRFKATKLKS